MNALPLAFGAPAILIGLIALPIIWWLLRVTPPRPVTEIFPPLKILAQLQEGRDAQQKPLVDDAPAAVARGFRYSRAG